MDNIIEVDIIWHFSSVRHYPGQGHVPDPRDIFQDSSQEFLEEIAMVFKVASYIIVKSTIKTRLSLPPITSSINGAKHVLECKFMFVNKISHFLLSQRHLFWQTGRTQAISVYSHFVQSKVDTSMA